MQHHNQQQHQQPTLAQNLNILIALCQMGSKIGEVFLRWPGTWGNRYAGFHMGVSLLVMLFFGPVCFPRENTATLFYLWISAAALLFVHRIAGWWRRHRGYRVHSLYGGLSIFSVFTKSETFAKLILEPLALILIAVFVGQFSPPLSAYLFFVAGSGFIATAWIAQGERTRMQSMLDAQIDAEYMQRELQRRMGNDF